MVKDRAYFIETFGCQANEADSQFIAGLLESAGLKPAEKGAADWIIINSCVVRQRAEDRIAGFLNNLPADGKQNIVLTGCVFYHNRQYLEKNYPTVDYFVAKGEWQEFVRRELTVELGGFSRLYDETDLALVPIMAGCDNFCTYCIVPYARGRVRSHPVEVVMREVKQALAAGKKKVLLLGQNVTDYGKDIDSVDLPILLKKVVALEGVEEVSFLSSHPAAFSRSLINRLVSPKISRQLHLPLQSGDDEILQKMNRGYAAADYLALVEEIRKVVAGMKITTDIIVGFPGETKQQFENTRTLCEKVGFDYAYINKYSPRPGTAAAGWEDNVSWSEKKRRWHILNELINQ